MKPSADTPTPPRRLRLVIVTDEMEVGGTQRQIAHLARGLDRDRVEATIVYFRVRSFLVDDLEREGIRCVHVPKRGRVDPGFALRLRQTLQALQPDVVHCFAFSGELWGTLASVSLTGGRRPAVLSSVRGTYEWYRPWQWRLKRWVTERSAFVVSNSREAGLYASRQMGLPPEAIEVVYNGAPVPELDTLGAARQPTRAALGLHSDQPMILFVGRLVDHKNVPVLLRAMQPLAREWPHARLVLAGDGPLRTEVEALIRELGLTGSVLVLGERDDAPSLMAACDFLVLPSLREGLSNVVLEGMMSGCAVIASKVGGNVELVDHEVTGLLFESDNAEQLHAAMRRLLLDPVRREELGRNARRKAVRHFGIPAMVRAYEQLYRRALSHRSNR